jgi:hypothetical protein
MMKSNPLLTAALAFSLSLPCLALIGCGDASASSAGKPPGAATTAEAEVGEQLSAADVREAESELELVADEERAYQAQNPVGRKVGRGR